MCLNVTYVDKLLKVWCILSFYLGIECESSWCEI